MALDPLKYTCWDSPLGRIFLLSSNKGLCRITINQNTDNCLEQFRSQYKRKIVADKESLTQPFTQINEYLQGKLRKFDINLDLDLNNATPFQKNVWKTLLKIPYGQVRSYQWVANQIKLPHGARAVGAANRSNPLPIIIPCHRIINANGKLGGYSSGVHIKRKLLELEGINIK